MKKSAFILMGLIFFWFLAGNLSADENRGATQIKIDSGVKGIVNFDHGMHQKNVMDCGQCHDMFQKNPDAIQKAIASGELKKKQVMNKKCLSCHKKSRRENKKFGPVKCSGCHKR